jgi:succinate-semialdehyde dehydrogenase/glutarate-semialdehyde dehydrogenase
VAAFDRSKLLRTAAGHLRERVESIAPILTQEQGKPIEEARLEIRTSADILEWFAEEARRTYGRVIPSRTPGVRWWVDKEPVGPVAAFTPWNFPVAQAARKLGAALAAGCSVILKGPEETPGSNAALVRALADAGLPTGAVNLVFGVPAVISQYLIPHPVIRKVSFTGSTAVGKQLAALATHPSSSSMTPTSSAAARSSHSASIATPARCVYRRPASSYRTTSMTASSSALPRTRATYG